jgi:lipoprotein-anchoring transpeptidase ErfK/SrfK
MAAVLTIGLTVAAGCGGAAPTASPRRAKVAVAAGPPPSVVGYARGASVTVYGGPAGALGPSAAVTARLANPNSLGAPLVFLVLHRSHGWDQVMLPQRPNGSTGWVRESALTLYRDDYRVVVTLAAHSLALYRRGVEVEHLPIAIGMPSSPTPPGSFYVTELVKAPDPSGPYGPYAFGLSDFSSTYTEFDGGPGQIAIHGTDQPSLVGQSVSHGCIRLRDANLLALVALLPVGTPVRIDA